jgi:N-acetylneuraminate synthase
MEIQFGRQKFNFDGLFTLEMANNHQGSVEHGKKIIQEFGKVVKEAGVRAALKFQFRNLDTFIHPDFVNSTTNKHIPRFQSTRLSKDDFVTLVAEVKKEGMVTMATPFDEASVKLHSELGIEILKIASCSAKDWPLLEAVASVGKPVIISTGGLTMKEIDNLVSFFEHRLVDFALMHCVAIYPTPNDKLELNQIELMRKRYPKVTIGFSTHEAPDNMEAILIAYAKGARIFERHVGVATDDIKLNAYSSTPKQITDWFGAYSRAIQICGSTTGRVIDQDERNDLRSLMRGVYAKHDIAVGEVLGEDDVFYAFPIQDGQLSSGSFKIGSVADRAYKHNEAISTHLVVQKFTPRQIIYQAIHGVKGMLNEAHIATGMDATVELSHHYGLENFDKVGAVIVDCINREYCKKLIIQLPGQKHPYHFHKKKEEAFQVLYGEVTLDLEGRERVLHPGDVAIVQRGVNHAFWTETGVIFEEISTTHFNGDSYYEDKSVNDMPREARKTVLHNWGRHQFD